MKLILLIVTLSFFACSAPKTNKNGSKTTELKESLLQNSSKKGKASTSFETNEDCVIFLLPSDLEIKKMQKENTEENYNEIIADITWYPGVAAESLDSLGIKNKMVDNEKFIILKRVNGKDIKLQKDKIDGDMILFRADTLPIISHAINFDREFTLNFYRKKHK